MQITLRLSFLIPALLTVTLGVDLWMRRTPISKIAFRAWEVASYDPTSIGPFQPNLRYFNPRTYGDLANSGDLPEYRAYHPETFTTDNRGFRNPGEPRASRPVRVVLAGDSFSVGSGLSDGETLGEQLAALSGNRVYNAAGKAPWHVLARVLEMQSVRGGTVLLQLSVSNVTANLSLEETPMDLAVRAIEQTLPPKTFDAARAAAISAFSWLSYSPLQISLSRAYRSAGRDRWLPPYVVPIEMINGHKMLFFAEESDKPYAVHASDAAYFVQVRDHVRATGNQLVVVMVPPKYRVYRPLMKAGRDLVSAYVNLAGQLEKAGVSCLDLTPALTHQAADLFAQGQYNYRDDDTHWNAAGARRAAEVIAAFLK
jgi:hypothetical protein